MRLSSRHAVALAVAAALVVGSCRPVPKERETPVSVGQTPPGVQEAARRLADKGTVGRITRRKVGRETQYAVDYSVGGADHTATIAADGRVVADAVEVRPADVPAPVADAVRHAHPKAMRGTVRRVTAGDDSYYRVEVRDGDAEREMEVDGAGRVRADRALAVADPDRQAVDAYRRGLR